ILGYGTAVKDNRFSPEEIAMLAFIRIHVDDPELKKWIDNRKYKLKYLPENISLNEWKEKSREN
ncbi:MAG: hypothetical protein HY582_05390, partial [Candidatus Omnitrophica bacterium]|nr:hypothetical protein [Candidatus Omnitrophota bacterium]